jgi:hypothetical protein
MSKKNNEPIPKKQSMENLKKAEEVKRRRRRRRIKSHQGKIQKIDRNLILKKRKTFKKITMRRRLKKIEKKNDDDKDHAEEELQNCINPDRCQRSGHNLRMYS